MRRILLASVLLVCLGACRAPSRHREPRPKLSPIATTHQITEKKDAPVTGARVLGIVAHPDDEIAFAGVLYKTATFDGGRCDLVVITNGEGGFKYSTLAEPIYGIKLTDETIGREALPEIRRKEQIAGGKILSLSRLYAFNQLDHRYTRDVGEILSQNASVWNIGEVRANLRAILETGHYDFVLTHLPVSETHGHHKAATALALEAVEALPENDRPIVLGTASEARREEYLELAGFPLTRLREGAPPQRFDRTQTFGYRDQLNYHIVVNWMIAEHKSQGTLQLLVNKPDEELYWLYDSNPETAAETCRVFFDKLAEIPFKTKEYGPSAGHP